MEKKKSPLAVFSDTANVLYEQGRREIIVKGADFFMAHYASL